MALQSLSAEVKQNKRGFLLSLILLLIAANAAILSVTSNFLMCIKLSSAEYNLNQI